jgi:hypothetical protein
MGDFIPSTPPPTKKPPRITLSPNEITTAQQLLANYAPVPETLTIFATNNGDFIDCLDRLFNKPSQTFTNPTKNQ